MSEKGLRFVENHYRKKWRETSLVGLVMPGAPEWERFTIRLRELLDGAGLGDPWRSLRGYEQMYQRGALRRMCYRDLCGRPRPVALNYTSDALQEVKPGVDVHRNIWAFMLHGGFSDHEVLVNVERRHGGKHHARREIIVGCHLGLGDAVTLTNAIRALRVNMPHVLVDVRSNYPEVFAGNPYLTRIEEGEAEVYLMHDGFHPPGFFADGTSAFWHFFHSMLCVKSGLYCSPAGPTPDLFPDLGTENRARGAGVAGPYWVMSAGYQKIAQLKCYPHWQSVVDLLRGGVTLVQIGGRGEIDVHVPLAGVVDLVGKTSTAELLRLVGDPACRGTLSGVTALMHIGAAFRKAAVVVAGGRESPEYVSYPGLRPERILSTIGKLPCCKRDQCYQSHANACSAFDGESALCMRMIEPAAVAAAIRSVLN